MKLLKALAFILCLVAPTSLLGAELYTWTDGNGVQHFSNQRPKNVENITVIQGIPESTTQTPRAGKATTSVTDVEETESQTQPKAQKTTETDKQMRPEDIDRYLGPCYVRYIKKKAPNGMSITTNANWIYQIAESLRTLVVEQWQVGDKLKICRERGLVFNMTRDTSMGIQAARIRRNKP